MNWKLPSTKRREAEYKLKLLEMEDRGAKALEKLEQRFSESEEKINGIILSLQNIKEYINGNSLHFGNLVEYLDIESTYTPSRMFYRKKGKKTK